MNRYLQGRVQALLTQYRTAALATCGPAGPQISTVTYTVDQLQLHLALPHGSDHLFNLETQPALVMLTAGWRLHGEGTIVYDPYCQRATVIITATRLHLLSDNAQHTIETIDF
ncbi:MAG: pyridoxamine 5'-phosphate oxidase family protein [Anaerolineae bacterium]|nr:pyridoxamine 5'-phosphate oxidase family protein [Anaerolineae bacterium]